MFYELGRLFGLGIGILLIGYFIYYLFKPKNKKKKEQLKEPKPFFNKLTPKEKKYLIIGCIIVLLWVAFVILFLGG